MSTTKQQIKEYIHHIKGAKQAEIRQLHNFILGILPSCKLWFLDGKNEEGKVVSNPNIGYGLQTIEYKDGTSREFYKIGLSANTIGISVYILGIEDKQYLREQFGERIGKASISGYCIKFKKLSDIHLDVLKEAIRIGVGLV